MIKNKDSFASIIGPIERGIDSLLEESKNPKILKGAADMKNILEEIKIQNPY